MTAGSHTVRGKDVPVEDELEDGRPQGGGHRGRLASRVAGLLVAAVTVMGCNAQPASPARVDVDATTAVVTTSPSPMSEVKATPERVRGVVPVGFEEFEPPDGTCIAVWANWPSDYPHSDAELAVLARECLASYRAVVLVNFGLSDVKARWLAAEVERIVSDVTDGLIMLDVAVVGASPNAIALLGELTPNECVEPEPRKYAAFAADAAMEELRQFDKILAVTGRSSCAGLGGQADLGNQRYADVYDSSLLSSSSLAEVTVHELLHLLGLGHLGSIFDPVGLSIQDHVAWNDGRPVTIDLVEHLEDEFTYYLAYHSEAGNIMADSWTGEPLDPLQQYVLEWPNRALGLEVSVEAVDITGGRVVLSQDTDLVRLARLEFEAYPLRVPPDSHWGEDQYGDFAALIFEPVLGGGAQTPQVNISLIGTGLHIASLGHLYGEGSHQLVYGRDRVSITISEASVVLAHERS